MLFPFQYNCNTVWHSLSVTINLSTGSQTGSGHCNNFLQKKNPTTIPPKPDPKETPKERNKLKMSITVIHRTLRPLGYALAFRSSIHGLSWLHIPHLADSTNAGFHEAAFRAPLKWQRQSSNFARGVVLSDSCLD